jgi:hypothetical protein
VPVHPRRVIARGVVNSGPLFFFDRLRLRLFNEDLNSLCKDDVAVDALLEAV